ncbi:DNA damage-binding protein 1, partial [Glycine soja]
HNILTISDGKMQLIKLNLQLDAKGSYVEVLERYVNLGPIVDFHVASVELQGIKGMWSLRSSIDDPFDTFLVVSFISETRILAMNLEDELEETEIEGFCSQVQTLFCHDAIHNQCVQVASCFITILVFFSS